MFSYEQLDSCRKESRIELVGYEDFYNGLKTTVAKNEYEQFLKIFKANDCITIGDWLQVYNGRDVVPFIEAFTEMAAKCYLDKMEKRSKQDKEDKKFELYTLGKLFHVCKDKRQELENCSCTGALKCGGYCGKNQLDLQALQKREYEKTPVYELLRAGMVNGPAQVFTKYHEKYTTCIRSYVCGEERKSTKNITDFDANSLYHYCSGDVMLCGKDTFAVNEK